MIRRPMDLWNGRGICALAVVAALGCSGSGDASLRGTHGSQLVSATADSVDVTSDAGTPSATFSATSVNFGLTECGTSAPQSVTVQNSGTVSLNVGAVTRGSWYSVSPASAAIAPGSSAAFTVTATIPSAAAAATTHTGKLVLTTNDPANAHVVLPLTATSLGATLVYPAGTMSEVDFGAVPPGSTYPVAMVLQNVGNEAATFAFGTPSNALFTQDASNPANQLTAAPGADVTLSLDFSPDATGFQRATMSAAPTSGATCGKSVSVVKMAGDGVNSALSGWPTAYDLAGIGIDFEKVACGSSAAASFSLSNAGKKAVTITGVTFAGTSGYSTDLATGTVIAAGDDLVVNVDSAPVPFPGVPLTTYPATLTITTDLAADEPHVLQLNESAYGAILAFDTSSTPGFGAFGPTPVGTMPSQAFQLVNTGIAGSIAVSAPSPFEVSSDAFYDSNGTQTPVSYADQAIFAPEQAGTFNDTLTATADALCQPAPSVALSGSVTGSGLYVYPTSLSFVASVFNMNPTQTFAVSNFTSSPVTWSAAFADADAGAPYFSFTPASSTLAPGSAVTVSVTTEYLTCVNPTNELVISSSVPGASPVVSLATQSWGYYIGALPATVAFGSVWSSETIFIPYPGVTGEISANPSGNDTAWLISSNASFVLSAEEPSFFGSNFAYGWQLTFYPSASQLGPQTSTMTFFIPEEPTSLCPPETFMATGTSVAP